MDKVALMDRIETKFVLSLNKLPMVLDCIKNDYRVVSFDDNKTPAYRTLYFDTDSLFFYHEHHRKRKDRYKVRFRNYVDSNITFLEVKHKKNGRVDKQRIKVQNEKINLSQEDELFLKEAKILKNDLKLKLINNYSRITLVSKSSVERVTIDFNIRFQFNEQSSQLENIGIIELKQPFLSRETSVFRALRDLQITPYNVSKYCIGVIKTHGKENVKYNRFKKKLIRLDKITQE
ncbi:polyphosphate polymerase domain-containing protein [Parvicella tangerina]|nr:polyphosphate polymerase domain-containing protein [Parvicella tangerina]